MGEGIQAMIVLSVSVALQFIAAAIALWVITLTGRRWAWISIATALCFAALHQSLALLRMLSTQASVQPDVPSNLITLLMSALMVGGVAWMSPLFQAARRPLPSIGPRHRTDAEPDEHDLFETVARISPVGMYRCDAAGRMTYANRRALEISGLTRKDATPEEWAEAIHPDDYDRVMAEWKRSLKKCRPYRYEYRLRPAGDTVTWVLGQAAPELDEDGTLIGFVGTLTDVTETHAIEQALRESKERFDRAVTGAAVGLWDWPGLIEGSQWWSPRFYELLGYAEEELRASRKAFLELLHPDDRDKVWSITRRHLSERTLMNLSCRLRVKDGTYRWFRLRGQATWDEAGKPLGLSGSIHDITERKKTQQALRESEKRLQAIARISPVGIFRCDLNGDLTFANERAREITGLTREDGLEARWTEGIHPDDREATGSEFHAALREETSFRAEYRFIRPDDSVRWVLGQAETEYDESGAAVGYVGTLTDITDRKEAEVALRASEEHLLTVLQSTADGILVVDTNGAVTSINDRFLEMWGVPDDLTESKNDLELLEFAVSQLENPEIFLSKVEHLYESREIDLDILRLKGGRVFERYSCPLIEEDGSLNGRVWSFRDITERAKSEQALKERVQFERLMSNLSADLLRASLTQFDDIIEPAFEALAERLEVDRITIFQWSQDGPRKYLYSWNSGGNPAADYDDLAEAVAYWPWLLNKSADMQPLMIEKLDDLPPEAAVDRKTAEDLGIRSLAYVPLNFGNNALGAINATMVHNERQWDDETVSRLRFVGDVISNAVFRCWVEDTLREEQKRLRRLLDGVTVSVGILTPDGKLIEANTHPFEGSPVTREQTIGQSFWDAYWWSYSEETKAKIKEAVRCAALGDTVRFDAAARVNGDAFDMVELTLRPLRDSSGRIINLVCSFMSITDRVRAEEERTQIEAQMQHAQKLESLGVLAGGIAHDFNNLLVSIMGNAELTLDELGPDAPPRENLIQIQKASKRAADLAHQMLAYSGRGAFVVAPIDLSELVEEMGRFLQASVSKKAKMRYRLKRKLPRINADATQIQQVVMNLITNASDALGDANGTIVVKTGETYCDGGEVKHGFPYAELQAGRYVYLDVQDNGCGMDTETLDKIFDPFFTTKFAGRGLGLAAVIGIVRGHNGAMRVHSKRGKGTAFRLLFPAVEHTQEAGDPPPAAADAPAHAEGTILVVDDEPTVRDMARRALEHFGYTVITAGDGREGVDLYELNRDRIAAVLLDVTMPVMSGEEAYEAIRAVCEDVPVLLMSGFTEQDATKEFNGRGPSGFLQKPFELDALRKALENVLAAQEVPA